MKPYDHDDEPVNWCEETLTLDNVKLPCLLTRGHGDPQHEFHILATNELVLRLEAKT